MVRKSVINRDTKETKIQLSIDLDGNGTSQINTGIGFLNHMLEGMTKHGLFNLVLDVQGDLHVDAHHTVEDTGIVLGTAIKEALGDKSGIKRYGNMIVPMDDALVLCALDIGGRPYLAFDYVFLQKTIGYMDTELVREFFYAISYCAGMNIHIQVLAGTNTHHIIEAMFKAFAKALDEAIQLDSRIVGVLSTKGIL